MLNLLPVIIAGTMVYMLHHFNASLKYSCREAVESLCLLLERTPALDTFLMFVIKAVLIVTSTVCTFGNPSYYGIISLDIFYFMSMLMLILYHTLKVAGCLLLRVTWFCSYIFQI
ncbi:MAG TPA: hypothetical protein GXX14_03450 [Clostridiaceae bacterium]|nr:hypothetical protein [Clostridiaceae bacterium]